MIVVGLIGWLSFRNGQRAINDLANKFRREIDNRIDRRIDNYLKIPHLINQLNAYAIKENNLSIFPVQGESIFLQQMNLFKSVGFIYCGSPQKGEFIGLTRLEKNNTLQLYISNESTDFFRYKYALDSQGNTINTESSEIESFLKKQMSFLSASNLTASVSDETYS